MKLWGVSLESLDSRDGAQFKVPALTAKAALTAAYKAGGERVKEWRVIGVPLVVGHRFIPSEIVIRGEESGVILREAVWNYDLRDWEYEIRWDDGSETTHSESALDGFNA